MTTGRLLGPLLLDRWGRSPVLLGCAALAGAGLGSVFDSGADFSLAAVLTPHVIGALVGLAALALVPVGLKWIKRRRAAHAIALAALRNLVLDPAKAAGIGPERAEVCHEVAARFSNEQVSRWDRQSGAVVESQTGRPGGDELVDACGVGTSQRQGRDERAVRVPQQRQVRIRSPGGIESVEEGGQAGCSPGGRQR